MPAYFTATRIKRSAEAILPAKAWNSFTEGYKNFPVGVMFEWYGPMQDSPVAPLHLKPVDRTLASTWLLGETEYYTVSYSPEDVGATPKEPFRFIAKRSGAYNEATVKAVKTISRLGIGAIAPEQFLFVIPR